jgi:hypothetical protein
MGEAVCLHALSLEPTMSQNMIVIAGDARTRLHYYSRRFCSTLVFENDNLWDVASSHIAALTHVAAIEAHRLEALGGFS